jgi:hypothetical protein
VDRAEIRWPGRPASKAPQTITNPDINTLHPIVEPKD